MANNIIQLDSDIDYKLLCQGNTAEVYLYDETKNIKNCSERIFLLK